jgi:hypothetical protein
VWVLGSDGQLWHQGFNGQWRGWDAHGGNLKSAPAAIGWPTDPNYQADIFARDQNNRLTHKKFDSAGEHAWENFNDGQQQLSSGPGAAFNEGWIALYAQGPDGVVTGLNINEASGITSWNVVTGGAITSDPVPVALNNTDLDIYVRGGATTPGGDGELLRASWGNHHWGTWTDVGVKLIGRPAAANRASGSVDLFWKDAGTQTLSYMSLNGGVWSAKRDLGVHLTSSPAAIAQPTPPVVSPASSGWSVGSNRIDIFYVDGGNLIHSVLDTMGQPDDPSAPGTLSQCDESALTPSACEGPWEFQTNKTPCYTHYATDTSSNCPVSYQDPPVDHWVDNTCATDWNPVDTWYLDATGQHQIFQNIPMTYHQEVQCTWVRDCRECPPHKVCNTFQVPDQTCPAIAAGRLAAFRAEFDNPDVVNAMALDTPNDVGPWPDHCQFNVINVPRSFVVAQNPHCGRTDFPTPGTIHHYECDLPTPGQCGLQPETFYSRTNLPLATLQASEPQLSGTPRCMTCDDLPLPPRNDPQATPAQAQAKATCLQTQLDNLNQAGSYGALDPQVRADLINKEIIKLKLLFELRGDQLLDTQTAYIANLYTSAPAVYPACGTSWTPPTVDAGSCGDLSHLNTTLQTCQAIETFDHAAPQVGDLLLDTCLGTMSTIAQLPDACAKSSYLNEFESMSLGMLKKRFSGPLNVSVDTQTQRALQQIDKWYYLVRQNLYGNAPAAGLWSDVSQAAGFFAMSAHQQGVRTLSPNDPNLAASLDNDAKLDLEIDRRILLAAFPDAGTPTIASAPLLYILSDALRPVSDKLSDVLLLHDVGCTYTGCKDSGAKTEVSELWALLASLQSGAAALDDSLVGDDWKKPFEHLHAQHVGFESAVKEAFSAAQLATYSPDGSYQPTLLTDVPLEQVPAPLDGLSRLIRDAALRTKNYLATGTFSGSHVNHLDVGVIQSRNKDVLDAFDRATGVFSSALSDYDGARTKLVNALLGELNNQQLVQTAQDKLAPKIQQYSDNERQILAIRDKNEKDESAFGDFLTAWKQRLQSGIDLGQSYKSVTYNFSVGASQAHWAGGQMTYLTQFGVVPADDSGTANPVPRGAGGVFRLSANKGEMIHINVDGAYSPSCAFAGGSIPLDNPMTGPEGYQVNVSSGTLHATNHTTAHNSDETSGNDVSNKMCLGAKFSESGDIWTQAFGFKAEVYVTNESCWNYDHGWHDSDTTSDSKNDSTEMRQGASFVDGLRLLNTPFPKFPAGALLLVEMPSGDALLADAIRVDMIHAPGSGYVALGKNSADTGATDFYLVVNDVSGCNPSDAAGALNVSVTKMTPIGADAIQLGTTMVQQLNTIRATTDSYVAMGRFSSNDRDVLEKAAFVQLGPISQVSPDLLSLFTMRVDYELARIDRLVNIENLKQSDQTILLDEKEIEDELKALPQQSRLLQLLPDWALRDLTNDRLGPAMNELAKQLDGYIYPILVLRYPNVIGAVKGDTRVSKLLSLDWKDTLYNQSSTLSTATTAIRSAFSDGVNYVPPVETRTVAVSFPNFAAAAQLPLSAAHQVDRGRADAMWTALQKSSIASLTVQPDDLYDTSGSNVLVCGEAYPVISNMELYVQNGAATNAPDPNDQAMYSVPDDVTFLTWTGRQAYDVNPLWLQDGLQLIYGNAADVNTKVQTYLNGEGSTTHAGRGLAPFAVYNVDLSKLIAQNRQILTARELLLVFQVEYQPGFPVVGVPVCR